MAGLINKLIDKDRKKWEGILRMISSFNFSIVIFWYFD